MGVRSTGLFYIFIYLPIYYLFTLLQRIYWFCNGMSDIVYQINAGQLYERSAQVFDIQWKVKKEEFQLLNRKNFIATHHSFEHPNFVLSNSVSLLCIHDDGAIFVEVPSSYNIFDCRQSPFVHLGQFDNAFRIITLPLSSLIQLGEDIGDPRMRVIWLHSTGRCGSTAVGQVFEVVPRCITLSEPMCLFTFKQKAGLVKSEKKYRQFLRSELHQNVIKAGVRLMAKPNDHDPEILFIKNFTLSGVNDLPYLERMFPDHTHLFLYRDCLPTVQSYLRSLNSHFWMSFLLSLRRNACLRFIIRSPSIFIRTLVAPEVLDKHQWLRDSSLQLEMTDFGLLVIQWGCLCDMYVQLREQGRSKVRAIRYEDIVRNKDQTLSLLFDFCGISSSYIDAAKKSLETDSQEGTLLSRSTLGKAKKKHVTESLHSEANFYLKAFKLGSLNEPMFLPGVLSPNVQSPANNSMVSCSQQAAAQTTNTEQDRPYVSLDMQV